MGNQGQPLPYPYHLLRPVSLRSMTLAPLPIYSYLACLFPFLSTGSGNTGVMRSSFPSQRVRQSRTVPRRLQAVQEVVFYRLVCTVTASKSWRVYRFHSVEMLLSGVWPVRSWMSDIAAWLLVTSPCIFRYLVHGIDGSIPSERAPLF